MPRAQKPPQLSARSERFLVGPTGSGGENTQPLRRSNQATERCLRKQPPRYFALALGHDGLWVFANRILANRIFADWVLADWRRRHRGRLLARQIGGSRNA